ncbi:MBL fold metallo-hydrolase [candidate division KSB1 bacterium]|nr:MAG: MBL fold metallo-hydrolase [candidate division KSB1 bacterium]
MQVELFSYGGAEEVTGSKHFLQIGDQQIMVDCGAFQGKRKEADEKNRNWPFDAKKITAAILTHAHFDHSGLIPVLPQNGFNANIYTTPASRDLASLIMMDSAHIQAKDIEFLKKKAAKRGETFDKTPIYTESDVVEALQYFITVSYHRPFYVADGVKATFYDAGHILGSAITLLEINHNGQKMNIGFSGDLGRKNLPILRDPEVLPDVDYLVMESTYGHRLHDPIDRVMDKLADVVNRTVKRGGKIIIPAFAVERTQELVYYLHLLRNEKRIPKVPVYVDSPMAVNATAIFKVHQECYDEETRHAFLENHQNPFGFDDLHYVTNVEESKRLNDLKEPAVIISSSGMCEAGRILHHLAHNIENPNNTIMIVGFMAQHTLGRRIKEEQPEVKILGDVYRLKAEVVTMNAFSAHADYNEIIDYISHLNFKRLKRIFLVHGEPDAQANLKKLLEERHYKATIVKYGERYTLQV